MTGTLSTELSEGAGVEPSPADSPSTDFAPEQKLKWLRPLIPKRMQPTLRGIRKRYKRLFVELEEPYASVFPFTQVNQARQKNLVRLADLVVAEDIPGDIVECGVLDGGTAALMAWATREATPVRPVHLFDAWEGLPETTAEDGAPSAVWSGQVVGSPTRALAVMKKLGIAEDRVRVHRGWFDDTFPHINISQAALVHVDCDFYAPTKLCLDTWYPLLAPGGMMQFDDYAAFSGCHKAVDEFISVHPELTLQSTDTGVQAFYLRKPK